MLCLVHFIMEEVIAYQRNLVIADFIDKKTECMIEYYVFTS